MDPVAEFLRREKERIIERWAREVRNELPALASLPGPALIDHAFELLLGLAAWIDGDTEQAQRGFEALIQGHALQRLGYAVGLETLMREYAKLRFVILSELLARNVPPQSMLLLHEGFDRAISAAIDRYAQRREEVRSRFISILGHDLRDPLSTVKISTEVLARGGAVTGEQQQIVARISRACDRMQRMIGEVLDFARGHLGGGIPANPTLNDMANICRDVVEEISAAHPQRTITLEASGDLRGPFDLDRVAQALGNIIGNAVEHTRAAIEVAAYETKDRMHVVTTVTSHGPAIPADVQRRIFDPFSRGDDAIGGHGLGLGMYIANQIALAHGATIDLTSDEHSTRFAITWPRDPNEERLEAANE
ncbi:MAG TPA: HAMP domain-containing sensor histidine kinase [Kofleriaceae bacterium]|nr:HAMP domain-containing sensor histidine kinase [Kofleriaceae bacterium]